MLTGLAATAASVLVGCSAHTGEQTSPDGGTTGMLCGNSLCIDLNDPANSALTTVDNSLVVSSATDRIIVIRTSATEVVALSDVCTHQGCAVGYQRTSKSLNCPCHGSRYALTGDVTRGPAQRPLTVYPAHLDPATNIVTITL
jgi:Rieske Fe-S protein